MDLQVGVKALIKNPEGKYLILHRSKEKYPEVRNAWDIVGGRITPGESLLQNLAREIAEETTLKLVGVPQLVAAQDILRQDKHVVRLTFVAEANGDVKLDLEHDQFKWLTIAEMKVLDGLDDFTKEVIIKNLEKL